MITFKKHGPKLIGWLAMLVALSVLTACQVRPLLGTNNGTSADVSGKLELINISEADGRLEQVVRNELIFLTGSSDTNSALTYNLSLNVTSSNTSILGAGSDNVFSAGRMTVSGDYSLENLNDDTVIVQGKRTSVAQYDLPDQEYSKIRALQDAENRAARELAAIIYADLAAALNK